jgi:hypothetical protein
MGYFILRNGEQYGPYSQTDVQRYLRTGDIFPGDLSRTEEMNEWLPVSRVLGSAAPPPPSLVAEPVLAGGTPATAVAPPNAQLPPHSLAVAPPPPGMHWGVLLLLMVLTFGFFGWLWSSVIAHWVRRIDARNDATLLLAFSFALNIAAIALLYMRRDWTAWVVVAALAACVLFVFAIFGMRKSIRVYYRARENILSLSAVMTFFFHIVYFQFKFNRIRQAKSVPQLVPADP